MSLIEVKCLRTERMKNVNEMMKDAEDVKVSNKKTSANNQ